MLIHTRCPIDGTDDADIEVYRANFDPNDVTTDTFSARRRPDRIHYRMVRNTRTGCLRADPVLDADTVRRLYEGSSVTQPQVADMAAEAYRHYLDRALPLLPDRRGALEIGCGHGPFLKHLRSLGFERVAGVELSADAVAQADEDVHALIIQNELAADSFPPETFSLVCGFQVLDHLLDPNACLDACYHVLAPGGVMYWICHNVGAPLAKLLGERNPMIDIEHVVLYEPDTLRALFERNGFMVQDVFPVRNTYALAYWLHLAPIPRVVKRPVEWFLGLTPLARWRLGFGFGNMGIVARKPQA